MHPAKTTEAQLSPALVFDMLQAHQRTAALKAAIDLDVFRAVGEGPGDVASIARHCSASERGIRILCDFLTINGVLTKEDGHYRHTPTSAAFLDPRSPACLASIAQFLGNPALREPYDHLAEIVRTLADRAAPATAAWSLRTRSGAVQSQEAWRHDGPPDGTAGPGGAGGAYRPHARPGYSRRPRPFRHRDRKAESGRPGSPAGLGAGAARRAENAWQSPRRGPL